MPGFDGWSAFLAFSGYELTNKIIQHYEKRLFYRLAADYATTADKPLLVIGAPSALDGKNYGDVCIDPDSEDPKCITANLLDLPYENGHFAACFCGQVPKSVTDFQAFTKEAARVSGKAWIAYPHSWLSMAWLHPGNKWLIVSTVGEKLSGEKEKPRIEYVPAYPPARITLPNLEGITDKAKDFGGKVLYGMAMGLGLFGAQLIIKKIGMDKD